MSTLPPNTLRVITGLVNAPQHNGRRCWIQSFIAERGRYQCVVGGTRDKPELLNVRPDNLREAVAGDFVLPPADAFTGIVLPPRRAGEVAAIAYPDMLMFQPFAFTTKNLPVQTAHIMMHRDVWMLQYNGWDGLFDSALHLLQHGYPSPKFFQYVSLK